MNNQFETLFKTIDENTEIIENVAEITYLEALAYAGEFLFQEAISLPLSEVTVKKLKKSLHNIEINSYEKEQIRKAFQLATLKGMKAATQPNHAMTPDAVAMFISYLVNKLTEKNDQIRLLDPAAGSANLLTTILNNSDKNMRSFAIEPDETLLQLGYVSANLQKHNIEFFHQDSLTEIFIDPVNMIVADLPIGYYPNEEVSKKYQLKASEGLSYTHHLIIEQSLNYTVEGGFLIFIIPNFMFESDQAKELHTFIKNEAFIYSLLQLPKSMFKESKQAKSIFIIRKKAEGIKAPSQALLAELPSFSNKVALTDMIGKINDWFDSNLNK